MKRFSDTHTQSRESGSSVISQTYDTQKNINIYLKKREQAVSREQVNNFPKVSLSPYITSMYGTWRICEYKTNILFGKKSKMNRHILFCGDGHTYTTNCDNSTFFLDWIYGMCLKHPTKKLTLLVEHPEKKVMPRLFDRKINQHMLLKLRAEVNKQDGPMFGIMWKLRKKINFENFTTIGIDVRQVETGGIHMLGGYYKDEDVEKLEIELKDVLAMYIHLLRYPTKKWEHKLTLNHSQQFFLESFFTKTKEYFKNVSKIIKNALSTSFFKKKQDLFYKILYLSLIRRLDDVIASETVIMDAYCLAMIFQIKGDSNIIVNVGSYHVETYMGFFNILKQTIIFTAAAPYEDRCVSFPKPYDFLE